MHKATELGTYLQLHAQGNWAWHVSTTTCTRHLSLAAFTTWYFRPHVCLIVDFQQQCFVRFYFFFIRICRTRSTFSKKYANGRLQKYYNFYQGPDLEEAKSRWKRLTWVLHSCQHRQCTVFAKTTYTPSPPPPQSGPSHSLTLLLSRAETRRRPDGIWATRHKILITSLSSVQQALFSPANPPWSKYLVIALVSNKLACVADGVSRCGERSGAPFQGLSPLPTPSPRPVILSLALSLPPVQNGAREHCSPHRPRTPATQASNKLIIYCFTLARGFLTRLHPLVQILGYCTRE